jgi:hypothetical protein
MIDDKLKKFLKDGWLDLGYSLNVNKCKLLADKVLKSRPWDESIFRSYKDINENPRHANVVPTKNGYNLAEKYDLDFIENNTNLKKILNQILGKNYEIILKKFVVSAPKQIIPEWLEPIIDKKLDGNLAQYIKPEFRDISYFSGIDYHMDLLDYANFNGDYLTLYIYLTDVNSKQSPLNIINKSHIYGATHFPHFLKKTNQLNKLFYSSDGKKFQKFNKKKLLSKKGRVYLWSALTIHGTIKSLATKPRVALRLSIRKNQNNNSRCLIDKLYENLNIRLNHNTRTDIKFKNSKIIRRKRIKRFLI